MPRAAIRDRSRSTTRTSCSSTLVSKRASRGSPALSCAAPAGLSLALGLKGPQPWFARALLRRFERRLIRKVDAVITVNDSISDRLRERYGAPAATIVRNAPPRQPTRTTRPDLLRPSAGIPVSAPVILYHGGFQRD